MYNEVCKKSLKRTKMLGYVVAIVINICMALGLSALLNMRAGISFEVAYFSTLLIIISSYYALQKRLARELRAYTNPDSTLVQSTSPTPDQNQSDKPSSTNAPVSKFMLGVQLSFGLYRLLSYIIAGLAVVILIDLEVFHILGYIIGVLLCLGSVIILRVHHIRRSFEKHWGEN